MRIPASKRIGGALGMGLALIVSGCANILGYQDITGAADASTDGGDGNDANPESSSASADATLDAGDGPACASGACGCKGPSDCPAYKACDPGSGKCSPSCDGVNSICNGGCCGGGQCQFGGLNGACGYNGEVCADCSQVSCVNHQIETYGTACQVMDGGGVCGAYAPGSTTNLSCPGAGYPYVLDCVLPDGGEATTLGGRCLPLTGRGGSDNVFCGCCSIQDCAPPSTRCVNNQCLP
jgi:hypothetical protein